MLPVWLIPLLMSGASLGAGALAGRQKKSTQQGSQDLWSYPTEQSAWGSGLGTRLSDILSGRLGQPTSLEGYEAGGMQDINTTYDLANQSLENRLGSMGLLQSPMAGTAASNMESGRAGELARFSQKLPLLQRQLQNEDINLASRLYALRPQGTHQTGTTTGEYTGSGNMLGGGFSNASTMLAFLYGMGAFGGGGKTGGSSSGGAGGIDWETILGINT